MLPRNAQSFFLVQRIRDEAHRYGITSHRRQRQKIGMASQLDALAGVGPTRRKHLCSNLWLARWRAVGQHEELATAVPMKVAQAIKEGL